ncbi:MAG: hypothetical protein K2F59_00310 [Eubacteriales bacterium]|nr:hypothetical protein [Eubacteriales bacterium]
MRKCLKAMLLFITVIAMLTGCAKPEEISATESAKALIDLKFFSDKTGAINLGMTEEECTKMLEEFKETQIKDLKEVFDEADLQVSDEKIEELFNSVMGAFGKLNYTIEELESPNGETKHVIIRTTYIDFEKLVSSTVTNILLDEETLKSMSDESQLGEIIANSLIDALNNATPSEETATIKAEFALQEMTVNGKSANVWFPSNVAKFGNDLTVSMLGE